MSDRYLDAINDLYQFGQVAEEYGSGYFQATAVLPYIDRVEDVTEDMECLQALTRFRIAVDHADEHMTAGHVRLLYSRLAADVPRELRLDTRVQTLDPDYSR